MTDPAEFDTLADRFRAHEGDWLAEQEPEPSGFTWPRLYVIAVAAAAVLATFFSQFRIF